MTEGERAVAAGERRIETGTQKLEQGMQQLRFATAVRVACALGAVFFAALSLGLGIYWRRSLAGVFRFKHSNS